MNFISRFTFLACLMSTFVYSPTELNASGYQPDSEGYAYTQSTTAISNSSLIPVAAVATAVIIGVILYSGKNHKHNHHHTHCH
jgi:hypothetical protein